MKFPLGALVVRKTGGRAMIVVDENENVCEWVEKGRYVYQAFTASDLMNLSDWMVLLFDGKKSRGKNY